MRLRNRRALPPPASRRARQALTLPTQMLSFSRCLLEFCFVSPATTATRAAVAVIVLVNRFQLQTSCPAGDCERDQALVGASNRERPETVKSSDGARYAS